ncbi:MAG: shikimate kinase [Sulfuricurvum sp.]|uniref:shikimate kinase n=1 Tax=Sulfuricurvum sp. TaxID=2025608 RepID=UPI00262A647E|nr:shikimate kinase [Sulfuricurvum sp.]MDD2370093.1 shikimate kinase [Sulfuricurvum sp.]MDD2949837.1 shikimate kinase [Sulfuricurvum sp.]MDD5119521.1 shikimate kinase [Sulfuricurvum sp.]
MKNIVLIGFMGVGKGSVAREIVKQSSLVALDTDDIIESMENRRIKKIFAEEGEEYFRELERKVALWLQKEVKGTLISTGGGFFKVPNLKKIGTIVYLSAPFDTIHNRILAHPDAAKKLRKRPLFQDIEKAKKLYEERSALYKKVADIIIDVSDKELGDIAKEILKKVK